MADYGADQYRWEHGILKGHEGHGCNWDQGGRAPCPDDTIDGTNPGFLDPELERPRTASGVEPKRVVAPSSLPIEFARARHDEDKEVRQQSIDNIRRRFNDMQNGMVAAYHAATTDEMKKGQALKAVRLILEAHLREEGLLESED